MKQEVRLKQKERNKMKIGNIKKKKKEVVRRKLKEEKKIESQEGKK